MKVLKASLLVCSAVRCAPKGAQIRSRDLKHARSLEGLLSLEEWCQRITALDNQAWTGPAAHMASSTTPSRLVSSSQLSRLLG